MATSTKPKRKVTKKRAQKKPKAAERLIPLPSRRQLLNIEAKRRFIEAMAQYGTITRACHEAGISRTTYYFWTDPKHSEKHGLDPANHFDPEFKEAADEAYLCRFQERVIDKGIERALDGWTDYHYDRYGDISRQEFKYDSQILQMLMKKADPALRDKTSEVNVNNQNITHIHEQSAVVLDTLTPQEKKLLLQAARIRASKVEADGSEPIPIEGEVIPQEKRSATRKATRKVSSSSS